MFLKKIRPATQTSSVDGTLTLRQALWQLLWYGLPTALSYLASVLSNMLAFSFIGAYTNPEIQAAHGLGFSIGNMLILTVGMGLVNGMDTLCPLSIGAGHPEGCWAFLFQALSIVVLTMPILIPVTMCSESILIFLKQDPVVSHYAATYLKCGLPGLFLMCSFEAARKFLVYNRYTMVHTATALFAIPVQAFFLYIFVGVLDKGIAGAGIARSCSWVVISSTIFTYIYFRRNRLFWSLYLETHPKDNNKTKLHGTAEHTKVCDTMPRSISDCEKTVGQVDNNVTPINSNDHCSDSRNLVKGYKDDDNSFHNSKRDGEARSLVNTPTVIESPSILELDCDKISTQETVNLSKPYACPEDSIAVHNAPESSSVSPVTALSDVSVVNEIKGKRALIRTYNHWWQGLPSFLKIAVPSACLCVFEWISFEVQIFMVAYLGEVELSALASAASLETLLFIISFSVAVALNSEVGRAIGSQRPIDAKTFAKSGVLASLCVSLPLCIGLLALHGPLASLYSRTPDIQTLIARNLLMQSAVIVCDSLHAVLGGVLKGLNLQLIGCLCDAFSLLGIMQFVGIMLAYHTYLKGLGFLTGTITGISCNIVFYTIILFVWINWEKRSELLTGKRKA